MPQPDSLHLSLQPGPIYATPEQWQQILDLHDEWSLSRVLKLPLLHPCIVVAGAYQGKLMQYFLELYPHAFVAGFEPAQWAFDKAQARIAPYQDRTVLKPYGLGVLPTSEVVTMHAWGTDECSLLSHPTTDEKPTGQGTLYPATIALDDLRKDYCYWLEDLTGTKPIDLLVINMEGYEYHLLPHLLDYSWSYLAAHVSSIAVQFHTKYSPSPSHYLSLLHALDTTYPHHIHHSLPSWGYWYNLYQ